MPEVVAAGAPETPAKGLLARLIGVIVSPRETYEDIVARPRILGALAVFVLIVAGSYTAFSMTQVGKELSVDQAFAAMDRIADMGAPIPEEAYAQTEDRIMKGTPWGSAIVVAVTVPIFLSVFAGLLFAVYTSLMGGTGTFKQVYAVVVHSSSITALQTLFMYPMFYLKRSMASPTSLGVFTPFLDEASFVGRLVGGLDLFYFWWLANLAIGVGVLYKRSTSPIFWTMMAVYLVVILCYAAVSAALSGA